MPIYSSSIAAHAPCLVRMTVRTLTTSNSTSPLSSYTFGCSATPRPLRPQPPRPIRVIPGPAVFSLSPSYRLTSSPWKSRIFGPNLVTLFADLLLRYRDHRFHGLFHRRAHRLAQFHQHLVVVFPAYDRLRLAANHEGAGRPGAQCAG